MHVILIELSMESHSKKTISTVQLKRSYASKQRFTHAVFWYRKLGNLSYFLLTLVPWLMCLSDNHANVTQPWKTLLSRRTVSQLTTRFPWIAILTNTSYGTISIVWDTDFFVTTKWTITLTGTLLEYTKLDRWLNLLKFERQSSITNDLF